MIIKALKSLLIIVGLFSLTHAESIEDLMSRGQALLEREAYSQAVTAFRQVVNKESDNFEAQTNLAFAYLQWGRNSNAVEEFKKALGLNSKSSLVWSNMAIAYSNLDKKEEALYSLNQAVSLDPSNSNARLNLAAMYANAGKLKTAIQQYKIVLDNDPGNEDAVVSLAKSLLGDSQFDEATKYFKQALSVNPNNTGALYELGTIYWKKKGDKEKALSEFKLAVSLQPDNPSLYDNYAQLLYEMGSKDDAIELLKKSLVYIDDLLKKEKVQSQIDKWETGGNSRTTQSSKAARLETKNQINDLKSELRKDTTDTRRIETKPVNVLSDFDDLNSEPEPKLDLQSEAKKRAANK
jgi:Flp pilus assembly protein TadD